MTRKAAAPLRQTKKPRAAKPHVGDLLSVADALTRRLRSLRFADPVTHVYNPLEYAREGYARYIERFGRGPREVVLLGMNPGPWGMAQTGVPFGAVTFVRDWMGIDATIEKPAREHSARPIEGFRCRREEVSGARLWSWARDRFVTADAFFTRFFVANYCPLVFMEASGRNRTPDKLPADERAQMFARCDAALRALVDVLQPRHVIGVGNFAAGRARVALADRDAVLGSMLHPSPASPAANRDWAARAEADLIRCGVRI